MQLEIKTNFVKIWIEKSCNVSRPKQYLTSSFSNKWYSLSTDLNRGLVTSTSSNPPNSTSSPTFWPKNWYCFESKQALSVWQRDKLQRKNWRCVTVYFDTTKVKLIYTSSSSLFTIKWTQSKHNPISNQLYWSRR